MSWRGQVEAWGGWFPPEKLSGQRLIPLWTEGVRLFEAFGGWLIIFERPRVINVDRTALLPVVEVGLGFASFSSARPSEGELVVRWQGRVLRESLSSLEPVELGSLWDDSGLVYLEGQVLQELQLAAPQILAPPGVESKEVREVLTAIPKASSEQKEWVRRSHGLQDSERPANPLLGFFDLLSSFFGSSSNQRYLSKMLDLFEKEQWQEALRYAIPLGDKDEEERLRRFIGNLKPRRNLDFHPKQNDGTYMGTSVSGIDYLRRTYEEALEALIAANRIEEAAFVKAELLHDVEGAVRMLEEHELYEVAAKLATMKGLAASLQVKLWFQAGESERALKLARCHAVHSEALHLLEQRDRERAKDFRVEWAEDLAKANYFLGAVEIAWYVRDRIPNFEDWLGLALEANDLGSARVMALVMTDPELTLKTVLAERLRDWFQQPDMLTLRRKRHLLENLPRQTIEFTDDIQDWAGKTARRVMRSSSTPWSLGGDNVLDNLVRISDDGWLKADRPRIPLPDLRLQRWHERVEQRGRLSIYDAASTGDGRILVALGHVGLATVSSSGAYSQRFDLPAHQLIAPLHGDLFLIFSQGRLGFYQKGRAKPLNSISIDGFADCHDGSGWLIWVGNRIYRIDLAELSGRSPTRWFASSSIRFDSPPQKIAAIRRAFGVLLEDGILYFELREMRHVSRKSITVRKPEIFLSPHDCHHSKYKNLKFSGKSIFVQGTLQSLEYQNEFVIVTSQDFELLTLCIFPLSQPECQLVLELPGAQFAQVRAAKGEVVVSDSTGRLLIADLTSQTWLGQFFL